jgi:hypothetical protein
MEDFDVDPLLMNTSDNKCELVMSNMFTKLPWKDKIKRCIHYIMELIILRIHATNCHL